MEERALAGLVGVLDGRAPLMLLHGLTFDRAMWRPALDALGRIDRGRQALALDLPGHGGSPAWPRYDIGSIAAAVQEAVTAEVWPGSGHFPYLAHPERFAACLAATARWGEAA